MLGAAAAAKWGGEAKEVTVTNGVLANGGRKLGFGDVAEAASKLDVPKDVTLKDRATFSLIGRKPDGLDNGDLMVGRAQYGIDTRLRGMLYAVVLGSPVFGGKVKSIDDSKAKAVAGVKHIVKIEPSGTNLPWSGVGIVATNTYAAMKGRDALVVTWDEGAAKSETTASVLKEMTELVAAGGKRHRNDGDVDAALASAAKKLGGTDSRPLLAHAAVGPMTATAA